MVSVRGERDYILRHLVFRRLGIVEALLSQSIAVGKSAYHSLTGLMHFGLIKIGNLRSRLFTTTILIRDRIPPMKMRLRWFLLALVCGASALAQESNPKFVGCYEVVSLSFKPATNVNQVIPRAFRLTDERYRPDTSDIFRIRALPQSQPLGAFASTWRSRRNGPMLDFSTGLGGYRGQLRRLTKDEYAGKLKAWCDYHCEVKAHARIQIRLISCEQDHPSSH